MAERWICLSRGRAVLCAGKISTSEIPTIRRISSEASHSSISQQVSRVDGSDTRATLDSPSSPPPSSSAQHRAVTVTFRAAMSNLKRWGLEVCFTALHRNA
ncbi:hypothetical protein PoB_001995000 [Plakobranchus ocellatus]|uniref:Uncharacterized protein n=1 Tax=Plakobranchus ocellatus TaxID=259542 RepID=A0AAV3ZFX8_9GAST|nr:hypothetical protein PoB_001995000 [Plakobranchus ocellatus]